MTVNNHPWPQSPGRSYFTYLSLLKRYLLLNIINYAFLHPAQPPPPSSRYLNLKHILTNCHFINSHFNRLLETSSSQHATASKPTMQNIVMETVKYSTWHWHDLFEWDKQMSRLRHQSIVDEPDERISVQEIVVSVPTRKRRISRDFSKEDSNSVSLGEKAVRRSPLMKRDRRKSKN